MVNFIQLRLFVQAAQRNAMNRPVESAAKRRPANTAKRQPESMLSDVVRQLLFTKDPTKSSRFDSGVVGRLGAKRLSAP